MLAEELPIYLDTFNLAQVLLAHKKNVSREVRFNEYTDLCTASRKALGCVYLANRDVANRYRHLEDMLMYLSEVKAIARLLKETEYLTTKKNNHIQVLVDKVSKQAIGWRGSAQRSESRR